ncbi:MAG: hypothetical protein WBD63_07735 [Phycisphaerae bacterium]|nr:hypothetical protein [Phycisphaerae bacterium]
MINRDITKDVITRRRLLGCVVIGLGLFCLLCATEGGEVPEEKGLEVGLRANKQQYVCGEPIVLQTTVANPSTNDFKSRHWGISWGAGFGLEIAYGEDGDFRDLQKDWGVYRELAPSKVPLHFDGWRDRHWLPQVLEAQQRYERIDLLVLPKPGSYRLRAVITESEETRFVSESVTFEVVPLAKAKDNIAELGDQAFAINLGSAIFHAHYHQAMWIGGAPPGESLRQAEFDKVAKVIIEKHKDSAFRETVMYIEIIDTWDFEDQGRYGRLLESQKQLAQQFTEEYPDSWLLPDVYRLLFFTYVETKDYRKAAALREEAVGAAPWATVLASVRKYQLPSNPKRLSGGASLSPDPEAKP